MTLQHTQQFRHDALLYDGLGGFVTATVPFLREGVEAGEPAMVAVDAEKIALLRDALDDAADEVVFVDMGELGVNPARIIPAWRDFVSGTDGSARGIGEPIWPGREGAELVECQLHESLLNLAFADADGFQLLCPYDTSALDERVVHEARCGHPHVVVGDERRASVEYRGPDRLLDPFDAPLPAPPARADVLGFDRDTLTQVRRLVRERGEAVGVVGRRLEDLVVAVNEIATNSAIHGRGNGVLRVWRERGRFVCEVRDRGEIQDPLVGRYSPAPDQLGGWGVWIANQVCELVQIRSAPLGTTVRIHTSLN